MATHELSCLGVASKVAVEEGIAEGLDCGEFEEYPGVLGAIIVGPWVGIGVDLELEGPHVLHSHVVDGRSHHEGSQLLW